MRWSGQPCSTIRALRLVAEYDHLIPSEVYEARLQQREGLARYIGGTPTPRP
jgi:hypothetical protein